MQLSYITKNKQGPVTVLSSLFFQLSSYITKNKQGPVTMNFIEY